MGAQSRIQAAPVGGGVFVVDGVPKKTLSGTIAFASNNVAEIWAAIAAVESFTRPAEFTLYSDSQYLINSMTTWIPKRGYENYANATQFGRLLEACKGHTIHWQWVKGHNGNPFNEQADQLAHARIFDGRTCESCGKLLDSGHLDFDWQKRELICGYCGERFPMEDVNHE